MGSGLSTSEWPCGWSYVLQEWERSALWFRAARGEFQHLVLHLNTLRDIREEFDIVNHVPLTPVREWGEGQPPQRRGGGPLA